MNDGWLMIAFGIFLLIFGIFMAAVSGAMPGAKPLGPPPRRLRIIMILFGALSVLWGVAKLRA